MQAQKAAIKAQRKAMDEMFQAMKRTYSELNSEQAELESALGSITARSLRSQPTPPAAMLSAMRSLPVLGLLTGKISTPLMLCFAASGVSVQRYMLCCRCSCRWQSQEKVFMGNSAQKALQASSKLSTF